MSGPQVTIDLETIERNATAAVGLCRRAGISVFGVTKGTCGMPQVARAMLRGGVIGLGESRFENIQRLRASGIDCPILLLRSPPLSRVEELVKTVDISLNSELAIVQEISRVAERMACVHDIILMVDLGDLREGIWPNDLIPTVEQVLALNGVRVVGIGTNLSCFGAIIPTEDNMGQLVAHARELEAMFGLALTYVSGGNSSSLPLVVAGTMPAGINNLRLGESILQGGRETFWDHPWDALDQNAFRLSGELLEVKTKPSMPIGQMGVDAFGNRPSFQDRGERLRGIVNIGREDVIVEGLTPVEAGVEVLGASSDHLVLDVTDLTPPAIVGQRLHFRLSYGALLATMTSEYVEKRPLMDLTTDPTTARVGILAQTPLLPLIDQHKLPERFHTLGLTAQALDLGDPATPPGVDTLMPHLGPGHTPLLLGQDHSLTLAGLTALARRVEAFGLLWFDARPSIMPPTAPGNPAPASTVLHRALGFGDTDESVKPQLSPENVVLIGLRDVAPLEAEILRRSRVTVFTIADIDAIGIREVMRQALRIATAGTRGLYVSYSPSVTDIPGTVHGSGGITLRETHQAMEIIAQTKALLAMDVVGLEVGEEDRVVGESFGFVMSCFGKMIF